MLLVERGDRSEAVARLCAKARERGVQLWLGSPGDLRRMSREVLARCTEPLFTTKPPGQGTGLGLSICKEIIQASGGKLELHSTVGRGTTAVVVLPAAGAPALHRPIEATSGAPASAAAPPVGSPS